MDISDELVNAVVEWRQELVSNSDDEDSLGHSLDENNLVPIDADLLSFFYDFVCGNDDNPLGAGAEFQEELAELLGLDDPSLLFFQCDAEINAHRDVVLALLNAKKKKKKKPSVSATQDFSPPSSASAASVLLPVPTAEDELADLLAASHLSGSDGKIITPITLSRYMTFFWYRIG